MYKNMFHDPTMGIHPKRKDNKEEDAKSLTIRLKNMHNGSTSLADVLKHIRAAMGYVKSASVWLKYWSRKGMSKTAK